MRREQPTGDPVAREVSSRSHLPHEIGRKERRKLRARAEKGRALWFGLGTFGLVGWSVAIPTLACVAIGVWLDARWPGRISWTLTLLVVGITLGCLNAWFWIRRESRRP
jgi:ATP synthase protein I